MASWRPGLFVLKRWALSMNRPSKTLTPALSQGEREVRLLRGEKLPALPHSRVAARCSLSLRERVRVRGLFILRFMVPLRVQSVWNCGLSMNRSSQGRLKAGRSRTTPRSLSGPGDSRSIQLIFHVRPLRCSETSVPSAKNKKAQQDRQKAACQYAVSYWRPFLSRREHGERRAPQS